MQPPRAFLESYDPADHPHVLAWWSLLTNDDQLELAQLYDPRAERIDRQGLGGFQRVIWRKLPLELRASLVEDDPWADQARDRLDLLEHFFNQEALAPEPHPPHICSAHHAARAALVRGLIPRDFTCPLERGDCLIRQRLAEAGGESIALRWVARLPWHPPPPASPHPPPGRNTTPPTWVLAHLAIIASRTCSMP